MQYSKIIFFVPSKSILPRFYRKSVVYAKDVCHHLVVLYSDPTGLFRTKEEAEANGGGIADDAEIIFDPGRGEWYIALDWSGTVPYSGEGPMTKFYGNDSNIIDVLDEAAPALLTGSSVFVGTQDNLINKAARETLDAVTNKNLKDTKAVAKAFGKETAAYYKSLKLVGKGATIAGVVMASYDMATYGINGGRNPLVYVKYGCDMVFSVIGSTSWVGMGLSVIYMFADYATDGFYIDYSIPDKKVKK